MQRAVLSLLTICICIVLTAPVLAAESVRVCRDATTVSTDDDMLITSPAVTRDAKVNYGGTLRVFVIEPTSRWDDYDGKKYNNAFLSFAINQAISVPYGETSNFQAIWNGSSYGFGNVTEGNIMVVAVIYNDDHVTAYSDPPSGYPFQAYYVDAAASATPGHTGYNTTTANSTHTSFIEDGSATWCPYCPATGTALRTVFNSGQYNFYYAAFVTDVNAYANTRMNDYNLHWLPSCYFDGGYRYHDGQTTSAVTSRLLQCGAREVPDLDLSVTLTWLGSASIQVDVSITNNQYVNAAPLTPATPVGPPTGTATFPYPYTVTASDPDGDPLYYMFDWGDGQQSEWLGPFAPGVDGMGTHPWIANGGYDIKAKAKDTLGAESLWSPATTINVTKPGNANGDASVNVGDAVYIISYIFRGGPAPLVINAADANCDNKANVGDAVYIISYIFRQGPAPGCQ